MKKIIFLSFIITAFSIGKIKAQSADEIVGDLINQDNYFELDKEYPQLKESMQSDMLKLMAEGLLAFYFNQPKESNKIIGRMLDEYQQEMGFENSLGMTSVALKNLMSMEKYDDIIKATTSLIEQIKPHVDEETIGSFESIKEMAIKLNEQEKTYLRRGTQDVEVPLTIEKIGRGELMFLPVKVNGHEGSFIFDTGCAAMNYVSQDFAKEIGIRIIADSLKISGVGGSAYGWIGIADSISIGDIYYYNSLFIVAPPNPADTVYKVNAVLGAGFLNAVGEIQIHANDNKMVFPADRTPVPASGRNFLLNDGQPYLKVFSGDEQLTFHFDTGNVKSTLFYKYYKEHQEDIERKGYKDVTTSGGFGGVQTKEVYKLPSFTVHIKGCKPAELNNVEVEFTDTGFQGWILEDGSLGMDFLKSYDKVTINYHDMFIKTE